MDQMMQVNTERRIREKEKNAYIVFLVFFYFFLFRDYLEDIIPIFGYVDELVAAMAIPLFTLRLAQNKFKLRIVRGGAARYIVIFFLLGLTGSIIYGYQSFFTIALPDAFLCIKFWLAMYVGGSAFRHLNVERYAKKIFRNVKFMVALYIVLILADWAFHIFPTSTRYGFRSTKLMYSHPTVFAACCVLLIMVLLMVRNYVNGYLKWLIILLILMCTTMRSKAIGGALLIGIICYIVFFRKKKFRIRTLVIFTPVVIAVAWEQIYYYFFSSIQSDSARYQLLVKAFEIAKDHFPLGSGFGTYASYFSGVDYSPLYAMYGLTNVNGLSEGASSFISDSFWPTIIGQTGFFGAIAYVIAIVMLFRRIQRLRGNNAGYYVAALSGLCYLLIASVAEAAFFHPVAIPMAVMIGFLLKQNTRIQQNTG